MRRLLHHLLPRVNYNFSGGRKKLKKAKRLISLITSAACAAGTLLGGITVNATDTSSTYTNGDLSYVYVDSDEDGNYDYARITGCDASAVSALIPKTIDNYIVQEIAADTFLKCTELISIDVNSQNPYFSSDNGILFDEEASTLICHPSNKAATNYTIPSAVKNISDYAFANCEKLSTVTIPSSVTSIGDCAFYGCSSLDEIDIPASVEYVGSDAFSGTELLSYQLINNEGPLYYADSWVIYCDTSITNISEASGNAIKSGTTGIAGGTFSGCSSLIKVDIPSSVYYIGDYAFCNCTELSSVTIPSTVKTIGDYAFADCSSIAELKIPDSVTSMGAGIFKNCQKLSEINLPSYLETIHESSFENCSSLPSVTIHSNITEIEKLAFKNCTSLKNVEILNSEALITDSPMTFSNSSTDYSGTIYGYAGSTAENYANTYDRIFKDIESKEYYEKFGYNGNTYQIVNEAISWTDAKERCELMGGHLVTIADEGEQLFVESIIQEYQDVDNFWTGGYLDKYSGEWVWIDGTPFEYTNWDDGQPDFHQNEEFYIRLTNKDIYYDTWIANMGKWNDCANEASGDDNTGDAVGIQTLAFVCEWDNTSLQFEKTDEDNDLIYDSNMISDCGEDAISVNIPSEFGDLPVTSIGENAFSSCSALENVRIPESVTAIEDYAFFGCNSLLYIAIPASVETIGVGALGYSSDGSKISGFTISGTPGSAAESYAFSNGFTFTATNADTGDSPVLSKTILSLNAGDSHVLQVKNYDGEITWVSNDNSVATVNKGFVSAVAEGETVIYAILTDAVLRCNITVSPKVIVTTPAVTTTDITTTTTVTTTAKIDYLEVKENNGTIVIIDCNELIINVVIPEKIDGTEVSKVNDYALSSEDIETVTFENPNVEITDSATTINEDAVIYGYWDSTAHDYAIKYDREFVSLDEPQNDNNEEQDNTNDDNNDNQSVPSITGDANNDGNVNVRDCAFIAQALAKGTTNNLPASADYNGDNKINVRDAAAIASDLAKPWKTTYRTQIIDHFLSEVNYSFKKEELKYALMYIDNDEIPEVLVYHIGSGVNALYSYYNNQAYIVAWSESARNNAFVGYMEKKGLYKTHLSAGAFSGGTNIYKLQNANASLYESIYFDVDMTTNEATYTFNGKAIDKNLFDQKTQQYENDFKSATSISYDEFIKRLS